MSTKILNAYKFKGQFHDILQILKEMEKRYTREKIEYLSKFSKWEFKKSQWKFLEKDSFLKDLNMWDLSKIIEKEMSIGLNTPFNISASAVVYPHKSGIYIQFFGVPRNYYSENELFEDFHYQNQGDMSNYDNKKESLETMTPERLKELEEDWHRRKEVWEDLIKDYDTFGESGFSFDLHPVGYKISVFCQDLLETINKNI